MASSNTAALQQLAQERYKVKAIDLRDKIATQLNATPKSAEWHAHVNEITPAGFNPPKHPYEKFKTPLSDENLNDLESKMRTAFNWKTAQSQPQMHSTSLPAVLLADLSSLPKERHPTHFLSYGMGNLIGTLPKEGWSRFIQYGHGVQGVQPALAKLVNGALKMSYFDPDFNEDTIQHIRNGLGGEYDRVGSHIVPHVVEHGAAHPHLHNYFHLAEPTLVYAPSSTSSPNPIEVFGFHNLGSVEQLFFLFVVVDKLDPTILSDFNHRLLRLMLRHMIMKPLPGFVAEKHQVGVTLEKTCGLALYYFKSENEIVAFQAEYHTMQKAPGIYPINVGIDAHNYPPMVKTPAAGVPAGWS